MITFFLLGLAGWFIAIFRTLNWGGVFDGMQLMYSSARIEWDNLIMCGLTEDQQSFVQFQRLIEGKNHQKGLQENLGLSQWRFLNKLKYSIQDI